MHDTSALSALYSALIQANATILAILGGFLLALAPLRGRLWDKLIPDLESKTDQLRNDTDRLDEILRDLDNEEPADLYIRYVQGKISRADLDNYRDALLRRSTELIEARNRLKDLIVESAAAEDRIMGQRRISNDYTIGARVLLIVGFFGILLPAILLAILPSDPAPFRRSYFALGAYASSLFGIVMFVAALFPESTSTPKDETPDFTRPWNILLILLVLCLLGVIVSPFFPLPVEPQTDAQLMPTFNDATPLTIRDND